MTKLLAAAHFDLADCVCYVCALLLKRSKYQKTLCDNLVIRVVKIFNNKVKFDHSQEFASVLKVLGRVRGALCIQMYLKSNKK